MTKGEFAGKTVVLTGVGRSGQVGEVVARAFSGAGAALVLLDRDAEVEARAREIEGAGGRAVGLVCDLTDPDQVASAAEHAAVAHGGSVGALVNLAGGFAMSGPVADSELSVLQKQIAINLTTAYVSTRAFLPSLRAAKGAIVFFASAAVLPDGSSARMSAYAAAKAGVLALMRSVAAEEIESGVRANAIAPTQIRTAENVAAMGESGRYVEREAVADAVLYLCSAAARHITGQTIKLQ